MTTRQNGWGAVLCRLNYPMGVWASKGEDGEQFIRLCSNVLTYYTQIGGLSNIFWKVFFLR